jgi:hypothetical protein
MIPADNADIDADEYEGLSGTFARACRTADRNRQRLGRSCRFGREIAIIYRGQPNRQSTGYSNTPTSNGCEAS